MSDTEVMELSNEETTDQGGTVPSPTRSSASVSSCLLDSFRLRSRQENGSRALDDADDVDKLVTYFSSPRWGVEISSVSPFSSLAFSTSPKARPPTLTAPLLSEADLMAPGTSTSLEAGPSVPNVATSRKTGPSDLDDSAPSKTKLSDLDAFASPKAGSSQDTSKSSSANSPILASLLSTPTKSPTKSQQLSDLDAFASPKAGSSKDTSESRNAESSVQTTVLSTKTKPTSIETESSTTPTLTSTEAAPLEAGSSTGSKLVIFLPTIRKASHNWKSHEVSARMNNSFTAAKSALEGGHKFHHDKRSKPYVEQHKVRRFRTADRKSSEVASHVSQTSSPTDGIPPSVSASESCNVGCIPGNTGKQFFDSLRSFLPQWIYIRKVPSQEPEITSDSTAQQKLLDEAFNRRLFEDEKRQTKAGSLMSENQSSPSRGAGESVSEISPSADETKQSSPNEDKISLEEKAEVEDDEKTHDTKDIREKRNTRKK